VFVPILSGLVVSVDAFFIGLSLGLQKSCRFAYLAMINAFLLVMCLLGYMLAGRIYGHIPIDPDLLVGIAFISLGLWTIAQFFVSQHIRRCKGTSGEINASHGTIVLAGLVMSLEAMLITMGLTLIFLPGGSTLAIPLTVALAHLGYSALSFHLALIRQLRRIPAALSYTVSGLALITYGLMALFVEIAL